MTSPSTHAGPRKNKLRGAALFWALSPVLLLGSLLGAQLFFLWGALDDPSFAVEEDYYDKALSWDATMAQQRENARLGWTADVEAGLRSDGTGNVRVDLDAPTGQPIEGARVSVEAFHNARASHRLEATLHEAAPGRYVASLPMRRPGLWEFRLTAARRADVFTHVARHDLLPEDGR